MEGQNQREEGNVVFSVFRDDVYEWFKSHITEEFDNNRQIHIFHFWCWKNALYEEEDKRNWQVTLSHKLYCEIVQLGDNPLEYAARQISKEVQKTF